MAAPTIYRSSDASAPTLSGTAGDLINLLNKCLVTGYGSQPAAGWTKPFDDAGAPIQRAAFRQGGGNQFYLDVDDRGASSVLNGASGREAAVRGYEAMTAIGTGTNPFPTTAQLAANTANWRKSTTADGVARSWLLIADDRTFIFVVADGDFACYKCYYFGDIYAVKTGDGYRTLITVRSQVNSNQSSGALGNSFASSIDSAIPPQGSYMARTQAGTGTAITANYTTIGSSTSGNPTGPAADGNIYIVRSYVGEPASTNVFRGWLRGFYTLLNPAGINDGDTFSGGGDLAGRNFVVVKQFDGSTNNRAMALETTAWDTSS